MESLYIPGSGETSILEYILDLAIELLGYTPELINLFLSYLWIISVPLSIVLVIGIITARERLKYIRRKEEEKYSPPVEPVYTEAPKPDPKLANRWKHITELVESHNQNDWRQAIIEADIILGEILDKMGYQGDGIGEKLKRVERADFHTLDQAWEAHKIRNIIAHEGASYQMSQTEVRRVINLFREVLEEFFYI